jgi:hypothetical protein
MQLTVYSTRRADPGATPLGARTMTADHSRIEHLRTLILVAEKAADRHFSAGSYAKAEEFKKLAASYRALLQETAD